MPQTTTTTAAANHYKMIIHENALTEILFEQQKTMVEHVNAEAETRS